MDGGPVERPEHSPGGRLCVMWPPAGPAGASGTSGRAAGASTVQHDLVIFEFEPRRCQCPDVTRATFDLENLSAGAAMEVVVVRLARDLISGRFARNLDRHEPSLFGQHLERAIDRRDAETRQIGLRAFEDFERAERAGRPGERRADGPALGGVARSWGRGVGHRSFTLFGIWTLCRSAVSVLRGPRSLARPDGLASVDDNEISLS